MSVDDLEVSENGLNDALFNNFRTYLPPPHDRCLLRPQLAVRLSQ